jgi:hypothetical protein
MTTHSRKRFRNKVALVGTVWVALFVLCLVALFWAMGPVRGAEAATNALPPAQETSSPNGVGIIGATEIITQDGYEPNDSPPGNTVQTGINVGTSCNTPQSFVANATLYKVAGFDVDNYTFGVVGNGIYTLNVSIQAGQQPTIPINFVAQIYNAAGNQVGTQTSPSPSIGFFAPADGNYRITLQAANPTLFNPTDQIYQITVCSSSDRVFATATPTITPTPTPTSPGPQSQPDGYEPNDSPAQVIARNPVVSFISSGQPNVGQQIVNLNFYPQVGVPVTATREQGDIDWYFVYLRKHSSSGGTGGTYRIATSIATGSASVDTELALYRDSNCFSQSGVLEQDGSGNPILFAINDDAASGNRNSQIDFNSDRDCIYWVRLINKDPAPRGPNQIYTIAMIELVGTPAPTTSPAPTTQATPYPQGIDSFEYNGDFDRASLVAPGVKYSNLNFVPFQPPSPDTVDNDFFRLPVKQGIYYTCETLDLAAGVDTNLIIYNQDRVGIGGNDDTSALERTQGKFGSRVTWLAGYTGIAYILTGEVSPPRPNEAQARTYALQCIIGIPNTPTPIGGPPTATPIPSPFVPPTELPPEPTMTPFPTPRTALNLPVRYLPDGKVPGRDGGVPTLVPTPTPRPVALDMQIFNDTNRNGLLDPGEGISGTSIRILDEASGTPLGQTATDGEGRARFTIFNEGPVRVSVPMFGYSTLINEPQATVRIALVPSEQLPARIP